MQLFFQNNHSTHNTRMMLLHPLSSHHTCWGAVLQGAPQKRQQDSWHGSTLGSRVMQQGEHSPGRGESPSPSAAWGPFPYSNKKNHIPAVKTKLGAGEGLIRASSTHSSEPNVFICHVNAIKGYTHKITEFIASKRTKLHQVSLLYKNVAAIFNICILPHRGICIIYVL